MTEPTVPVYRTDPERETLEEAGIPIRAIRTSIGAWDAVDIAHLDRSSLVLWLRSRGGSNLWAENTVLVLLGHPPTA